MLSQIQTAETRVTKLYMHSYYVVDYLAVNNEINGEGQLTAICKHFQFAGFFKVVSWNLIIFSVIIY